MKKIFLTMSYLAISAMMWAVPAKRGVWKTVKLADGTEVRVELRGDEHVSFWQAKNGRKYTKQADSEYFVETDMKVLSQKAMSNRSKSPLRSPQKVSIGDTNHPSFIGSKKGLIILVNFKDRKFLSEHDEDYYGHLANDLDFSSPDGHRGSIRDYFLAQSEGQFDLTFDVVGPIELQYNMEYYGGHSPYSDAHDKNPGAMIAEAIRGAASKLGNNMDAYDWFGDGSVDQVFVLYAGYGEATGGGDNTVWPHRSSINAIRVGGKSVSVYACSNELNTDDTPCGIGTFCHEFSHCLGLPDLYDTQYGGNYGMGTWDLMNSGCYNGDGYRPCGYSGYERNFCGWREPKYLTENTRVDNLKGLSDGGDYYIIKNDAYSDEYYILENRTQTGWDSDLYGSGLLITHIDYNQTLWAYNLVNSTFDNGWISNDHERYAMFLADNSTNEYSSIDIAGDVYPYNRNNALADYTTPAAILYHPNKNGSLYMNKPVTNITRNSDNTISFDFADETGIVPEPLPEGVIFRETFDKCNSIGGNDGIWAGGADIASGYFIPDNVDWNATYKYGANKCARFGTNAQRGIATTPDIEISGTAELSFLAAPWTGEAARVTLLVTEGTATLSDTSFDLEKGKWTTCKSSITGEGKVKIQFRSNRARFFLDEVSVYDPAITGITSVGNDATSTKYKIYTVDGRYAGNDMEVLGKGVYIVNGKKIIR
mgnify:CR=1 FL=1